LQSNDLSDYIRPYDSDVIQLAESIGLKPFLSYPLENTEIAYYWVSRNIRYMYDRDKWGVEEYWQLPGTTVRLGTGDCEDQAILLVSLLRALKLPRNNVRVVVGPTGLGTYHAWVEIKLPFPIYGLEKIAASSLELLRDKRVTISIGEVSSEINVTDNIINSIKTSGLRQNDGWIPLDPTAKILGYPIPFSWWLTYGYNIYIWFGCRVTPQLTFQDKARMWVENRELGRGESISFDVPCLSGDKIIGVAKATNVWKTQILERIQGMERNVGYSGPFYISAGEKIKVEWVSDRAFSVYILTESQFRSWTAGGIIVTAPGSYCIMNTGTEGAVEYIAKYSDNFYVVLWLYPLGYWGVPAKVYDWRISKVWQETICNVQVSVIDPLGTQIISTSITQREVETHFDFTAERNGVYKVMLKNMGEPALIYVRLEEYPIPIVPETAGASEILIRREQEYLSKITEDIGKVSTSITISVEPGEVLVGEEVIVKGYIGPLMNATIALIITKPDGAEKTLTVTSNNNGSFSLKIKLDREGTWAFVASYSGDFIHEAAQSAQIQVEVKILFAKLLPYLMAAIIAATAIIASIIIMRRMLKAK